MIKEVEFEECRFESRKVGNTVGFIANPESAGPLSKKFIKTILEKELHKKIDGKDIEKE